HFFLGRTLGMTIIAMGGAFLLLRALQGGLLNGSTPLGWLLIGFLWIGAGKGRLHYHSYLTAALRNGSHARATMGG
ncbi:regulatory signaling modulator protein AmpE, partial [Escherichia coli]|nr:regulatory signaling modulator protein AmpE [Escherichia coli]